MKLQIDTVAKTITLEQSAKITELLSVVKKLFPHDEWKEYALQAVVTIYNWHNPVYIPFTFTNPIIEPYVVTSVNTETVFCIETN